LVFWRMGITRKQFGGQIAHVKVPRPI